ncbi:sodium/bile acid cotransporter 7 [Coccidioides immitis RMSCC 3703]|uniref:Sodium/bile acid cotransporter 7 n=2 Tax=Coccidioides immitis TaxID=5501 RepID=A0A0J8QZR2_COCIT|nr:sodium/bile acid cotransporter 7 /bile acid cotransporter 7 [Coccidioides immitis RMSCC 2394]KMU77976.1 sodium/bile acid cotransporter 7 [Coccidioides immitis RMSCC 3703]
MESQATNYQANSEKQAPPSSVIGAFILRQYLLIGIGISCLLAYFFPNVAKHGGIIHAEYSILYGAVAIIFLISGLSIAKEKLILQLLNYRVHILVQGISFLVVPAIMVAFVQLIYTSDHGRRIDEAVLAGYILVACFPTTISSNVAMTREAGGDDAVALMEVLVANMLGPFVTPGWTVTLLPKSPSFDLWRHADSDLDSLYRQVFQSLGLSVLIPLVLGQVIRWTWPQQAKHVVETFHFSKISGCCLILLTWTGFSTCFATQALESMTKETIILVVFFNIGLYLFLTAICYFLCRPPTFLMSNRFISRIFRRLPPVETIAVCFCGPAKTTGLGIPMLYAMYKSNDVSLNARMSVPVILYTTEQIFSAHFMVHLFRAWLRKLRKKEEASSRNVELDCGYVVTNPLPT